MLGYLKIDNGRGSVTTLHDSPTASVVQVDGLIGLPAAREAVKPKPDGHGTRNRSKWLSDRIITITGEVWGSSVEQAFAEFDAIQGALYDALDDDVQLLYRRGDSGPELQQAAHLSGDVKSVVSGNRRFIQYEAALRASDALAFSQAVYTVNSAPMGQSGGGAVYPMTFPMAFTLGSAGQVAFNNAGPVPTPPTFRLYGRLVNPRVRLLPDGPEVVLTGTIAAGDYMELDRAARSVLLNGSANRNSMRDFAASQWFDLPRGSGTVVLTADDFDPDAYLSLIYRNAYGG